MLFSTLLKLWTTIITKRWLISRFRWQIIENWLLKYAKQRKVVCGRRNFWNTVLFKFRRVHFLCENPTFPPRKIRWHDLKRRPLNFQILETPPPSPFKTPKVHPLFKRGGSSYGISLSFQQQTFLTSAEFISTERRIKEYLSRFIKYKSLSKAIGRW